MVKQLHMQAHRRWTFPYRADLFDAVNILLTGIRSRFEMWRTLASRSHLAQLDTKQSVHKGSHLIRPTIRLALYKYK